MKILKGLALSFLSFLLFLSLSIFGFALMLNNTILNPDFVTSELNRLDVSSLAGELFSVQAPPEAPYLAEVIEETIDDLEPWIKERISTATYSGYDYLMGRTQSLSLTISTEPARDALKENLWQAFLASPPPELQDVPPDMKELHFNEFYQQLAANIPPTLEFTENSLPPDVLATLGQVRRAMGYFRLGYQALIGFMLLLVLGIILISRQVRDTTRRLGTTFLTYGGFEYAGIFIAKYFAETRLPSGIPPSVQIWIPQFLDNLLSPLEMFSLGLLIGGLVLIIVSFVYKLRQPSF